MNPARPSKLTHPLILGLLASFCCLLWGSAAVVIKLGYGYFSIEGSQIARILLFAGCRFFLAGVLLFVILSVKNKSVIRPQSRGGWLHAFIVGVVLIFLQYMFNFIGVANASGVNASVLNGVGNMFSILFACLIFRQEKMTGRKLLGCALGLAGIVVMNLIGKSLGTVHFLGEGFLLIASLCGATGNCLVRNYTREDDPTAITVYHLLFGGFALLALGFLLGGRLEFSIWQGDLCIAYLGALSATVYIIWNRLLKENEVSKVTIYGFLIPIFGVMMSALILGETEQALAPTTWITLVLVCLSIIVVSTKGKGKNP